MTLRPVVVGFMIAGVFWFLMFSPWTAGLVNFWLAMSLAGTTLVLWSFVHDRKEIEALYAFRGRWIAIGLASAVLLYLVFFVGDRVSAFLFEFSRPQIAGIYSTKAQASPFLIGSLLLLLIGPAEEIFWRGFAQRRMQGKFGAWKGFLLTTAVYGFVHIWAFNFMLLMAALICGFFWGWMYLKYKSVWPGLISHAVWDLFIFVIVPIQKQQIQEFSMNAVALYEHGGTDKLVHVADFPTPVVGPDEVLIEVKATAVNRVDLVVRGGYPGIQIPLPHILGGDIAGTIAHVGQDVKGFTVGQRVVTWPLIACGRCALCAEGKENLCLNWKYFGLHRHGGYAQYVSAPASSLLKLPDSIAFEEATALGVAGLTAYHAVTTVGQLTRGQSFFIWGGSGGVGTIAIQLAKLTGASVVATAGKDEKLGTLKDLGADHVFNHYTDDVSAKVRALFPAGIDLIIDYVGPATFPKSFDLLKKGGSMLLCGILTGRETNFSIHQTYLRHLSVKGLYLGTKAEMQELLALTAAGKVKPVVGSTLPLREAAGAHTMMAKGEHLGKIVLTP